MRVSAVGVLCGLLAAGSVAPVAGQDLESAERMGKTMVPGELMILFEPGVVPAGVIGDPGTPSAAAPASAVHLNAPLASDLLARAHVTEFRRLGFSQPPMGLLEPGMEIHGLRKGEMIGPNRFVDLGNFYTVKVSAETDVQALAEELSRLPGVVIASASPRVYTDEASSLPPRRAWAVGP